MRFRSLMAALAIVIGSVSAIEARQSAPSLFAGRWTGQWQDASGTQGGVLDLTIDQYGRMAGLITNGALPGTWQGQMRNDGSLSAAYKYAGIETMYPYEARGVWGVNDAGQLAGEVEFLSRGERIGVGHLELNPAGVRQAVQIPQGANHLAFYPYGVFSYLNAIPRGGDYLAQHGLGNINVYRQNPGGYVDAIVPGYGSVVSGALADIQRLGGLAMPSSSVRNTVGMINRMVSDATRLSPAEVQRKYGGMNALASAIAAQNEIYNRYHRRMIERQAANAQSQTSMAEFEAEMAAWRAAWAVWESQLWRAASVP